MLLRAGIAVPFIYFGTVFLSALSYPGYSHVRQYASELGSASAPFPLLFNGGILLTGVALLLSGAGFARALTRLRASRWVVWPLVATVTGFGLGMVMGAWFPMPDPRHGGFGLGLGIHLAPALLAVTVWNQPKLRKLRSFLWITTGAVLVLFAIMMGVGAFVTRANVGAFQRVYAMALIPWIGVASYALLKNDPDSDQVAGVVTS